MTSAFKDIRLTNSMVNATGGVLRVGAETVVYQSVTGQFYPASNPSGYVTSAASIANLALTGSNLYNLVTGLSGQSNLNYATIPNLALTGTNLYNLVTNLSGQANLNYATIPNLATTGTNLYNLITALSGQSNLNYATITNLASTGQQSWLAANNNGLNLSGNLQTTGSNLYNLVKNFSGNSQCFITGINPTGFDSYMVTYPLGAFPVVPRIQCTIEVSGGVMYGVNITGRTTTNYWAIFSDTISESGVVLHTFATINQ